MTTKIQYDVIDDVSSENGLLKIPVPATIKVSACVWTMEVVGSVEGSKCECLDYVLREMISKSPTGEFLLISGHKIPQPVNRITKYNCLWRSLEKLGIAMPQGDKIEESLIEHEKSLRAFGVIRFDCTQSNAVNAVMSVSQGAIAFMPKNGSLEMFSPLIQRGWAVANTKPPMEIIDFVYSQEGLIVDVYGGFDDFNVAVAAVGEKSILQKCNLM